MLDWGQGNHDLLTLGRIVQRFHRTTRHETLRQVIGDVLHPDQTELLQRLAQFWPHAVQRVVFNKQGIQGIGAHAAVIMARSRLAQPAMRP